VQAASFSRPLVLQFDEVTRLKGLSAGLNLNSDIEFTENPISFGIDTLKREVSTSPKLDLL
jgi:hypothetical protein